MRMIINVASFATVIMRYGGLGVSARGTKGMNRQMDGQSDVRQIPLVDNEIQSSDLFKYGKELSIVHNNEVYKLRLTGNSKLILTK